MLDVHNHFALGNIGGEIGVRKKKGIQILNIQIRIGK